ncbi:hypothetical protein SteCoe_31558 [Stentor coeruleus]|uniref:Casein kinase I n=1 Tax=Stentor coeruleus TaxID=5963 RepID=A0A1R2B0Z8_9CILI|nr:hypothetical protein SteCoe_31558 [Stentor coeruleus]
MIINRFNIDKELGKGSFGVVHKAWDNLKNQDVALKLSDKNYKNCYQMETQVFSVLSGKQGFPKLIWKGEFKGQLGIAMELLGDTLTSALKKKIFATSEICEIGYQMIQALDSLHKFGFIHQDIKPCNILLGSKKKKNYHLIDFGMARSYIDKKTKHHIPQITESAFKGNLVFCSNNIISGIQASRRDDIISLLLVLFFIIKRGLPWIKSSVTVKDIVNCRMSMNANQLNKMVPCELVDCLAYAQGLSFYQKPDYDWILNKLKKCKILFELDKTDTYKIRKKRNKKHLNKKTTLRIKNGFKSCNLMTLNNSTIKATAPEFSEEFRQKIVVSRKSN